MYKTNDCFLSQGIEISHACHPLIDYLNCNCALLFIVDTSKFIFVLKTNNLSMKHVLRNVFLKTAKK